MKRIWLWSMLLVVWTTAWQAGAARYDEGIEYQPIVPPQPTEAGPERIEVVELFWYGCPHCYSFEPHLRRWLARKPEDVIFRRVPAQLNPSWEVHAAAFYTAALLGVVDQVHEPLFKAIHERGRRLNTPEALAEFFQTHAGVEPKRFLATFESFAVRAKLASAKRQVAAYGAHSVPTVVVNGKYLVTAERAGGSYEGLLSVVDFLIDKERKAAARSPATRQEAAR